MGVKLLNIVAVVNEGCSDKVMEIAKDFGAGGGTIIQANGSASMEAMKLYGLGVHPNKEIVMILVEEKLVNKILEALYTKFGPNSEMSGIFFTLPVSYASDNILNQYKPKKEKEEN